MKKTTKAVSDVIEPPQLEALVANVRAGARLLADGKADAGLAATLATAFLAIDKHMIAGGDFPATWAARRQRCRGFVTSQMQGFGARCALHAGHSGECGPKEKRS